MHVIDLKEMQRVLRAMPELGRQAVRAVAPEIEIIAVSDNRKRMNQGVSPDGTPFEPMHFPRPEGGNKPLQNKGILAASISAACTETELQIRANAPGAKIHQEGGTIRPVNAKALAIPITKEAVRAGSPRSFPAGRLFVFKGQRGAALAESVKGQNGKKDRLIVHYLLRASVTIPKREYLGLSGEATGRIAGVIATSLEVKLFEQLKGGR